MTEDRIREFAQQCFRVTEEDHETCRAQFEAFIPIIRAAVAEEREACAAICDAEGDDAGSWYGTSAWMAAEKIRARGKPE